MAADYSRIHRLLKILMLIQAEPDWTAQRLAGECDVSVRTIYRDMKMLEGAGIPYFYDEQSHGYQVRRDFFMPPVQLTLDESLALVALAEHIGGAEQIPMTRPASRAIAKVKSHLPHSLRDELEKIDHHVAIHLAKAGPHYGFEDVYEAVRNAITRRRVLECKYESVGSHSAGADDSFLFKPYTLFFSQRAWYVVGHHGRHDEVRCLKLNRFTKIQPTREKYDIPADFTLKDYLGHAWRMIRGDRSYDVELWFDAEFAETIADTNWHPTQVVDWHEDGSIVFRCTVDGLDEIVWWVLSMGPHCRVVKPAALAEWVVALAGQVVARYQTKAENRN